jgi:hypothetical protein
MSIDQISKSSVLIASAGIGGLVMEIEGHARSALTAYISKVHFGFIRKYADVTST